MTERYWKIDIQPYDQVLALTQHMINNGIDNLYTRLKLGEVVDGAKMPKPFTHFVDEHNGAKNVVFGPPTVTIDANFSNVTSVKLNLHLQKGDIKLRKFTWIDQDNGEFKAETWDMKIDDWVISVPVDVGFVKVDKDSVRGKAIIERSAAKGNPNHSIHELLLDLSTMTVGNAKWEMGDWTDNDWLFGTGLAEPKRRPDGWKSGEPRNFLEFAEDFRTSLEFQLSKLSLRMQEANMTSLGFAVMADDANKRATFEVNNTRYMTYPWIHPESGKEATAGLDGDGRLNYLLYLETVGTHQPPKISEPSSVLNTRMGNWTDGRKPGIDAPSKFGSFVMSVSNFMESYLVPKFSDINRIMSMDISGVTSKAEDGFFSYHYEIEGNWRIGSADPKNPEPFKMKREPLALDGSWQDEAKNFLRPLTESPGDGATIWTYKDVEWGNSAKHSYAEDGSLKVWHHGDTITFSRLYTLAAKNEIVYEGRTWTKFEYKVDPGFLAYNVYGNIICECTWKIILQLTEVTDGGIKITIDKIQPTINIKKWGDSEIYDGFDKPLSSVYVWAASNFEYFLNGLRDCLQGQEQFTLPASGVYYFKNPIMDSKGNLVCELEYNGNPKLGGEINPNAENRDKVARGNFNTMPDATKLQVEKQIEKPKEEKSK